MTRTKELAQAIADNPKIDESLRRICRTFLRKWAKEDQQQEDIKQSYIEAEALDRVWGS
jgi:hypothetical protein